MAFHCQKNVMYKIFQFLSIIIIILFIFNVFKNYLSNKNISNKNFTRSNIDQILKEKIKELPILDNDTNNVIQFNDTFEIETKGEKKRSFWNLLKNK